MLGGRIDLLLQLGIGSFQRAHLLQVGGQTVIQVLHGGLLVQVDGLLVQGTGQVEACTAAHASTKSGGHGAYLGGGDAWSRPVSRHAVRLVDGGRGCVGHAARPGYGTSAAAVALAVHPDCCITETRRKDKEDQLKTVAGL